MHFSGRNYVPCLAHSHLTFIKVTSGVCLSITISLLCSENMLPAVTSAPQAGISSDLLWKAQTFPVRALGPQRNIESQKQPLPARLPQKGHFTSFISGSSTKKRTITTILSFPIHLGIKEESSWETLSLVPGMLLCRQYTWAITLIMISI